MLNQLKIKESLKSIKILMVEDDRILSTLIRDVLTVMGFTQIIHAKSAEQAMQEVNHSFFDLILCDWKMGEMSGIEFTYEVRWLDDNNRRYTPIIMITGMGQQEDVMAARDAGVTEYIIKPFSVNSLFEKIKNILEKPRQFVVSNEYAGPDRRRRQLLMSYGSDRRKQNA